MNEHDPSDYAADAARRFQCLLQQFVDVLGNLGALAAIDIQGAGRSYFTAGAADSSGTRPAKAGHLFQIGSQSKTFVAVTLVLLERAGKLTLDDRVVDHLDLPIDARITLRHLLMNTSGLGEYTVAAVTHRSDPRQKYAPRDLVTLALPQGQIFAPGEYFDYCNTGWVIAAMIIEKVERKPYQDAIRDRVLAPLGLDDTVFGGKPSTDRMLRGYIKSDVLPEPVDSSDALGWAYGAGDGVSSLDDMLDFYGSLIRPGSPIGVSLDDLSHTTARASANPYVALSIGAEYGLGLEKRAWAGREVWGHPGGTVAYSTATWVDAGLGVTVTTCITRVATVGAANAALRYPREQLFAMALNTAYALRVERQRNRGAHFEGGHQSAVCSTGLA